MCICRHAILRHVLLAVWITLVAASASDARIVRIEITRVESPAFDGAAFGEVGQYEKLIGRAYGEVDPNDPQDAVITDLTLAPKNVRGRVEYATDLQIVRPLDPAKGNHRLFVEINNRGTKLAIRYLNDTAPLDALTEDAGNGFLMRQGYTLVWMGWDSTVPTGDGRLTISVPIARNPDGSAVIGPSLEEFVVDNDTVMTAALTYPAKSQDQSAAQLVVRSRADDLPTVLRPEQWEFVNANTVRLRPGGKPFDAGKLYELSYQAKDPTVAGLGLAAIRDVTWFLRQATKDDVGHANPVSRPVQFAYAFGVSQAARTLHDFLWLGFNAAGNQRVFEGIVNWIGGPGGVFLNFRFAQPGRTHRQHIGRHFPEFQTPLTNQVMVERSSGKSAGRLSRCLATNTCPKIFELNSSNEYWAKAMSRSHVSSDDQDLDEAPNVRSYLLSSLPHAPGRGRGICQQELNPLLPNPVLRALLVAMDAWVTSDTAPPANRLPRRADGTLARPLPQTEAGFPQIPGVLYNGRLHTGELLDFGPTTERGVLTRLPPSVIGSPYPVYVPRTDVDGNDIAGIRLPEVAVPIATYTGWALRADPKDDDCSGTGQKINFATTKAERMRAGDPRLSIEERYSQHHAYVEEISRAANALRRERFFLEEDVQRAISDAVSSRVP